MKTTATILLFCQIVFAGGDIISEGCTNLAKVKSVNVPLTTPPCSKNTNLTKLSKEEIKKLKGCLLSGDKKLYHCARISKSKSELSDCLAN